MRYLSVAIVGLLTGREAIASEVGPAWWHEGDSPVIIPEIEGVDHRAPVNIGQLKAMAWAAKMRMDRDFSSAFGASRQTNQLVATWFSDPQMNQPLNSGSNSVANVGQVKAVGKLFYDHLAAIKGSENAPQPPWTTVSTDDSNYSPANLGQLKNVFSFDLQPVEVPHKDTDFDGLNDWWELFYFDNLTSVGLPDINSDSDNDGRNLATEAAMGTNPNAGHEPAGSSEPELIIFTPNLRP